VSRGYAFLSQAHYANRRPKKVNASSHRNAKIKELVNKNNTLLYSIPYQHFTNSIENYFSMMKSKLHKLDGLTHSELKANITKVIKNIPKKKYENIIKGTYNRTEKFIKNPSNRTRKRKNYL
jgi:enoyl-[acyl-carrier-protein] reductase (NADH)